MTAVRLPSNSATKKAAPNKVLLGVLGLLIAFVLVFKVAPGLVGGGGTGVTIPKPLATFHLHAPLSLGATAKGGPGGPVVRTARDPFGAPPGYATPGH